MKIREVSSPTATLETTDAMLKCNCAANAIAVTLGISKSYEGEVNLKKTESSANAVTITPASGETIDGAASITITTANEKKTLIPVDGGWTEVDNINDLPTASVTLTGTQTLTNKTLTTPVIASLHQDAAGTKVMTIPNTASDTLVGLAATQTLTNKRLTSPKINEDVALSVTATKLNNVGVSNDITVYNANGAIAISGVALITGGTGLASLTLAAPTVGARMEIIIDTLTSGDVVLTTAPTVTFDGTNNTATFNAVADSLLLIYKSATQWQILRNTSVSLSAV